MNHQVLIHAGIQGNVLLIKKKNQSLFTRLVFKTENKLQIKWTKYHQEKV